jgi:hypothetical protein
MGPDLLRFAVLPASERWEMGETTSHPLVYDATPRVNPPHRPRRRPRGRFWGTPPANVVAFADICFPLSDAFSTSNGKKLDNENDDEGRGRLGGYYPPTRSLRSFTFLLSKSK